uniref:Uncharacterized protein n=1 Tax=Parascaris equorum TaxID=6256 RepID=A0A914RE16_PAREQ
MTLSNLPKPLRRCRSASPLPPRSPLLSQDQQVLIKFVLYYFIHRSPKCVAVSFNLLFCGYSLVAFFESDILRSKHWDAFGRSHKDTVKAWMLLSSFLSDRLSAASRIAANCPVSTPRIHSLEFSSSFFTLRFVCSW